MKFFLLAALFFYLTACAGNPPFLEYTIAQEAIKAARKVNSGKNAVAYWTKALESYQRGENRFQDRDYISAERFFNESIKWAEKAENLSRFKMSTGEGI